MSSSKPGLIERALCRVFAYHDIMGRRNASVLYLRRFFILHDGMTKKLSGSKFWKKLMRLLVKQADFEVDRVYLHKICRSDDDPDPHDHPWQFRSFVLAGGYYDETWEWDEEEQRRYLVGADELSPGDIADREPKHLHRVRLFDESKPTWTLVLVGNKERDWYFVTKDGPVFWRTYLNDWSDTKID